MHMTGEQRIAAPRQRVWEALNDPEVLRASIPGCQTLVKEGDDRFLATVEVKIGPIGARFKGDVGLTDLEPGLGYTIVGAGNGGIAGSAKGNARVRLSDDGAGTLIRYTVEAEVGGRMAQLGGPIIDATAKNLSGKFFGKFGEIVGGASETAAPAPSAAPAGASASPAAIAAAPLPAPVRRGVPLLYLLGLACALSAGILVGNANSPSGTVAAATWQGLFTALVVLLTACAGFEYGRRSVAPTVILDTAHLRRLLDGARE